MTNIEEKPKNTISAKLQEIPLTIREHQDPDKHWIGETLPVPTQTEIAATIGTTSGPGDSPFPARADHTHKISTTLYPKQYNAIGVANSGISTTEEIVCTLTIPSQAVAGHVIVWGILRVDQTVTTDRFGVNIRLTNASGPLLCSAYQAGQSIQHFSLIGVFNLIANLSQIIVFTVFRQAGTGTGTTFAFGNNNRLIGLWIPI